ncbi:uncharacterized protein BP01DRAFT_378547 [Aspergillus saccharolyticus JOP 1030-1]|uniref:Myb-like DNA-binding domain-containing protein n=1 Tax=Aspergillus saccharolyticus JOP 1030-1 TaxID=1450539 RepID=A0A318ZS62_9EURO|nr:hypothetical protein BP01DRAFT_378547 [Aspergillus saccharolyticus JOP 1030-1]PYH49937.1 hypothetical protein BP01DRAFT_378547 [Aspergillus saccharolyticus JOP 1030-1]
MPKEVTKRGKAIETDTPTALFLYSILGQLELRQVDWEGVARDCGISNGHAARMRYARFKSQMENKYPDSSPALSKRDKQKSNKNRSSKTGQKILPSPSPEQPSPEQQGEHTHSLMKEPVPLTPTTMPSTHQPGASQFPSMTFTPGMKQEYPGYYMPPWQESSSGHSARDAVDLTPNHTPDHNPKLCNVPSLDDVPHHTSDSMSTLPMATMSTSIMPQGSTAYNPIDLSGYGNAVEYQPQPQLQFQHGLRYYDYDWPLVYHNQASLYWSNPESNQVIAGEKTESEHRIKEEPLEKEHLTEEHLLDDTAVKKE